MIERRDSREEKRKESNNGGGGQPRIRCAVYFINSYIFILGVIVIYTNQRKRGGCEYNSMFINANYRINKWKIYDF